MHQIFNNNIFISLDNTNTFKYHHVILLIVVDIIKHCHVYTATTRVLTKYGTQNHLVLQIILSDNKKSKC